MRFSPPTSIHYVWFLVENPDCQAGSSTEEEALTVPHIQYQLRLHQDGQALAIGGLSPLEGDPLIGMTILRASEGAEFEAIANSDPALAAGRFLVRIREWWVPTGQIG